MGHSIFDFTHQYDNNDIKSYYQSKIENEEKQQSILFRMKYFDRPRSKNSFVPLNNYKVINCFGRFVQREGENYFLAICEPLISPFIGIHINSQPHKQIFISKHSLDMKFEYVDER